MVIANRNLEAESARMKEKVEKGPSISWDSINEACAFSELCDLTPAQRIAYLSYWYMSEVDAGGHNQYFIHSAKFDQREIIDSLRAIGADEQSAILARALKAIAPSSGEAPLSRIQDSDLAEFDEAFEDAEVPIASRLFDYVNSHESEFAGWAQRGPLEISNGWALPACLLIPAIVGFLVTEEIFHGQFSKRVWSGVAGALLGVGGFVALEIRQWLLASIRLRGTHQNHPIMLVLAKWTIYLVVFPALLFGILLLAAVLL